MAYQDDVMQEMKRQSVLLAAIVRSLEALAHDQAPLSPGYRRRLNEFDRFDWASIGATVVAQDVQGVAEIEWRGHRFDRKSGEKYNDRFIIFSRPTPNWTQENKKYYTLIKFADYNKAPLDQATPKLNGKSSTGQIEPMDVQHTTESPVDDLLSQARRVTNEASFWELANRFIRGQKTGHKLVSQVVASKGDWREKALALVGA